MKRITRIFGCVAIMLSVISNTVNAQTTSVATLNHNGEIKDFYSTNALTDALKAASDGDIITLSAGIFKAADIKKAVKLFGAGASATGTQRTIIDGDVTINIPENSIGALAVEGVYFNSTVYQNGLLKYASFNKCHFYSFYENNDGAHSINCHFHACRIDSFSPDKECENLYLTNCVIHYMYSNSANSVLGCRNCVITYLHDNVIGQFENCILGNTSGSTLTKLSTAVNCLFVTLYYDKESFITNCWRVDYIEDESVFAGVDKYYLYEVDYATDPFTLSAEAAAKYIGTDGTQIGIHGGQEPYSDIPSIPAITSCNIPSYTTKDGKLDVQINVQVQR